MNLEPPDLPLETERLTLRDYSAQDWEAVHRYNRHEDFWRFLPIEPQTPDTTEAFVHQMVRQQQERPRREYTLAAVDKETSTLIGGVGIRIKDSADRVASIGYGFDPECWGKGFATEAAGQVIALGFEHVGLHRIFALCAPENIGSMRVLEKLGMRREGHLRRHMLIRDEWRDSFVYAILEDEFAANRMNGLPDIGAPT